MSNIDPNIAKWQHILDNNLHGPNTHTTRERLQWYLCSLMLGREFLEDTNTYIDRSGHKPFFNWAESKLKEVRQ